MENKNLKIVFLGPPTSGKGTQSDIIADKLNLEHISTGEIFRQNVLEKTELGLEVKELIEKGVLVSDEITNEVVKDRLEEVDGGFILDGYPRSVSQAKALDEMLDITHAFLIQISDEEVIRRVTNRRVCTRCGKLHNLNSLRLKDKDHCLECGGELELRADDTKVVMEKRMEEYHEITEPMIDFYRKEKVLFEINGEQSIEKITQEILDKIEDDKN